MTTSGDRGDPSAERRTVAAYDADASGYHERSRDLPDRVRDRIVSFATRLGAEARVLEIGSGGGRDALALEEQGLAVRRTDVTPAFVAMMRAAGHRADVLDPLTDDLADPERSGAPYDGVWANACLLHVARSDLGRVLGRLASVSRTGGVLACSLKEGDGEAWSTHGAVTAPRRFVYWRAPRLSALLEAAGWDVESIEHDDGMRGERWLTATALRGG